MEHSPRKRRFANYFAKRRLLWVYRGIKACCMYDDNAAKYCAAMGDCTIRIRILPDVTGIVVRVKDGATQLLREDELLVHADLDICFKNLAGAMPVLRGRKSVKQAYAEKRIVILGDISKVMMINNIIRITLAYVLTDPNARKMYGEPGNVPRAKIINEMIVGDGK